MNSYQEYKQHVKTLQATLDRERKAISAKVLQEIRECIAEFGFTPQDVFSSKKKREPKYYDPVSGSTWTGLGREPEWIRGKDRKAFELSGHQRDDHCR
ncbi:H-NS histone family protein [Burkholderia pseudomallei]|uniref:H-NS histone family protein n=1 Tax=Burkholderia pseudomallei TaxID=28450 RepID=UPI000538320F|nr:H-NS histone family protein [Burkholderia pseudomallei]KGW27940.1 H-NS histone family protein [Burkholderia pseudomallei MSHR733]KGX35706.1 H-NS histone family protein [Burkholderia pseudomallei MSHR2138]MBM5651767.1 H-NS histone family protein [Burkholderia pseudomallei]OMZ81767.1 hypothetical protein AQ870_12035 [Burkholderia pseudomallei]OND29720.1 hypothetical protein AQ931_15320 [Burkholderia pseudomallei]